MQKFSNEFYASRIDDWKTKYVKLKELCKLIKAIKKDIQKNGGELVILNNRNPSIQFDEIERQTITNRLDRHSVNLSVLEDPDGLFNKNDKIFQTPLMYEINEMFPELDNLEYGDDIKIFLYFLTIEVHNVYVFYLSIEKNIFKRVNEHSYNRKKYNTMSERELLDELVDLTDITYLMYSFYSYIDLNVKAVREILKYFDENFLVLNHNISINKLYFKKYLAKKESDLKYILGFKIIIESSALIESYYQEIVKICNTKEIKEQKKELKEVLSYLNEKNTDRINDDIHEVYLKQKSLHFNNIIKQKKNAKIDIQNSFCVDVHQDDDFYKALGEKQFDEEINIRTTRANIYNLIFLFFHTFIYSFFYIIPYIVFYFYFVENGINIYYLGFILTSTHLGNFISKIIINCVSERYKIKVIFFCVCFILSFWLSIYSEYYMKDTINIYFTLNLISRFVYGFSCGRLLTRGYIIQFLPESEIKFFQAIYLIIIYLGFLCGIFLNFLIKDLKPLYISTFSFYLGYNNLIFAIGAGTSLIYLILILIFFTEPSKGTMLNQYRAIQKQKIEEDDAKKDLLDDEKNLCDYKELYDENETGDDTQKLNNLLFRESEGIGRNTTNKEMIIITSNLDDNMEEMKNKTFDEKNSKGLSDNLLESKDITPAIKEKEEKDDDELSTPLNISSIKNKDSKESKDITSLEFGSNNNRTSKNSSNNKDLMSAEEIKGLNSIEKELINMNSKNNFDDVNLMPNELERIRTNQFKNNRNYLCAFFVFITIQFLTNSLNEFIILSAPLCFISHKSETETEIIISEKDVIIIIMVLQIFSFPFIIFFRKMRTFNVERKLLLIFYAALFGLMILFLFCKYFFYEELDNSGDKINNIKNILYRSGIIVVYILSNLMEGTTNLLGNKIIPAFVKVCGINNKYINSYSTVFGKILGGLFFCLLCLTDEDDKNNIIFNDTNVFKYNIIIFSSLTIILFLFFLFSYKKLYVKAIAKLIYIND